MIDATTLTISPEAAAQILELLLQETDDLFFRVEVVPGGCSGYRYRLGFDTVSDDDLSDVISGVPVVLDKESADLLKEASVDYATGLSGGGFSVSNAAATRTCGCGKSFS